MEGLSGLEVMYLGRWERPLRAKKEANVERKMGRRK